MNPGDRMGAIVRRAPILLCLLAGCYGGRGDYEDRTGGPVDPSYAASWDDVRDVIWREWGKATWTDIGRGYQLRKDEKFQDSELFVLLFLAVNLEQPLLTMVDLYKDKNKDLHQVVLATQFPRDGFFTPYPEEAPLPPGVFAHPYNLYRTRAPGALTNEEYASLVQMRIAVDYFAHQPEEFFAEFERLRGFQSLFTRHFDRANWGRKAADGTGSRPLERPWDPQMANLFDRNQDDVNGE